MNKPRVEGSTENIMPENERKIEGVEGLQDVPHSIIPVPYYTLVQPESTKVTLPDGKRAPDGSFLMNDVRKAVGSLRFIVLRAKRQTRMLPSGFGGEDKVVSLNILGYNLDRQKPFILNVPVTSFSAFGKFFDYLVDKKATKAWQYAVEATTEEVEGKKQTGEGLKLVQWWVVRLDPQVTQVTKKTQELGQQLYYDYADRLDRNDDDELESIAGKVFNSESKK